MANLDVSRLLLPRHLSLLTLLSHLPPSPPLLTPPSVLDSSLCSLRSGVARRGRGGKACWDIESDCLRCVTRSRVAMDDAQPVGGARRATAGGAALPPSMSTGRGSKGLHRRKEVLKPYSGKCFG